MNKNRLAIMLLALFSCSFQLEAKVDDQLEAEAVRQQPWQVTSNLYLELEEFKGYKVDGNKVYDKISPTAQLALKKPDSDWSYFMEYKLSMRRYTTSFRSEDTSFNRNRFQLQANRKLYQGDNANLNLSFVYRKESNDVKAGQPAMNSYHSYWLIPAGGYKFTDQFSFVFWDAFYYYDNFNQANSTEWESEHGFQYRFNDQFSAKLMYYTDWTWDGDGNKNWEQNQIRGYFPGKFNQEWELQPYFRYFINERNYDTNTGRITQAAEHGGLRLGFILTYNLSPKTALWTNMAWERTRWDHPKPYNITYGDNNNQDFRLYSIGVRHSW